MFRKTYLEVSLENIYENAKRLIQNYPDYTYYFGVVKADAYGHGIEIVSALKRAGINYFCVATLEEALQLREKFRDIPILCLGYIDIKYLPICVEKNITITVPSLAYAKKIDIHEVKCHIKIDTGMHRLGIGTKEEYEEAYHLLEQQVEGVYTHLYQADEEEEANRQLDLFEAMIENTKNIPIIHVRASEATIRYPKREIENGCRLGIALYGLIETPFPLLDSCRLVSYIVQIHELQAGEKLGYGGDYVASKKTRIAVVPIGYADGIIRKNTGRMVYIHNKPYTIVGRICMDMLFVEVDDTVNNEEEVEILKDKEHIKEVAAYLDTISYEVLTSIGKRVTRIWK